MGRALRAIALSGLVLSLSIAAGCGTDNGATRREPTGSRTRERVRRQLDDVPKYPRSKLVQADVADRGRTFVGTYTVAGATPVQISEYLGPILEREGWTAVQAPIVSGDTVRSQWDSPAGERSLLLSSAPAPTAERSGSDLGDVVSQYSLTLEAQTRSDAPPPPS